MTTSPIKPNFDRATVLQILKSAFYRCAEQDYAHGHVHNEEDMRAGVYRYVRNDLDCAPLWRVFTNLSAFIGSGVDKRTYKPDLTFFHSPDGIKLPPKVEIFVEIKHWPDPKKIEADVSKLGTLRKGFKPDVPDLVFFAIVGNDYSEKSAIALQRKLERKYPSTHVWLKPHILEKGLLYDGPWDETARFDPWRKHLRHIK